MIRAHASASLLLLAFVLIPRANAALVISHGDFSGNSVMYLDVSETANTPDDEAPFFRKPSVVGNKLDFNPSGFAAAAIGGPDLIDVQLNFTLMTVPGQTISTVNFNESGDYTLLGAVPPANAITQINYSLAIGSVTLLEVDGQQLAESIELSPAFAFGGDNIGLGVDSGTPWSLRLSYDVNAALISAGVPFVHGATKLEFAVNNSLSGIADPSSIAFIAKKDFSVNATTQAIPEPSAFAFLGLIGLVGMFAKRRTAWFRSH